jgi:hypothetical protein
MRSFGGSGIALAHAPSHRASALLTPTHGPWTITVFVAPNASLARAEAVRTTTVIRSHHYQQGVAESRNVMVRYGPPLSKGVAARRALRAVARSC